MKTPLLFLACSLCAAALHAQGTIRATTTIHPDGTRSTSVVDPDKMTMEETVYDGANKVLRKVTYLLDERNQPLGSIAYDPKGVILYKASYKRDGAGRIEEESISSAEGQFIRRRVYTYGAQNKVTNMVEYDAQGNIVAQPRKTGPGRPDKKKK